MFITEYDLSITNNIKITELFNNNNFDKLKLINKLWMKNNKVYNVIKYDKAYLTYDMVESIGKWRSVILSNNKIVVFSPPKSLNVDQFISKYNEQECIAEEFIEGTMINLFYDKDIEKWEIASKSSVGGNIKYFKEQPIFSELFYEICSELNINLENLCKDYCYSFVIQHPKNKFVIPIKEKRLYLIACYKIDNETFKVTEISKYNLNIENVCLPQVYNFTSYNELYEWFASYKTHPCIMGVMIHHNSGVRTKLRNPNYQYIKELRGNNTKIQYQYLCLRKLDKVKEYLKYFPETSKQLMLYRKQIHEFTNNLHVNYINCYINKKAPLKEFPIQYRSHMYNLHQHYLTIRADKGYINKIIVINYINNLEPSKLMYSLNYHMRQLHQKEDIEIPPLHEKS
jgi:hypothetical protein